MPHLLALSSWYENPGIWFMAFAVVVIVCCVAVARRHRWDSDRRGRW